MNAKDSETTRLDPSRRRLHARLTEPPVTAVSLDEGGMFAVKTSNGIPPEKYPV
jgi:hypothetical protein